MTNLSAFLFRPFVAAAVLASALVASPVLASPCVDHFVSSGGLIKGTQYSSWVEREGDRDSAVLSTAQAVGLAGWNNLAVNESLGLITANMQSTMGKSSTNPLSIVVKALPPASVRIEGTIATAPLQKASANSVRDALCRLLETQ